MSETVPPAWVTAGLNGVIAFHKRSRNIVWACPSSDEVAAIIAAAAPLIAAAGFHEIRELAKRTGAVATGSDGVTRLFADVMDREMPGD